MAVFVFLSAVFVVSVDADSLMWIQTYGGTGEDYASALVATSDGGYAIAGSTSSFGVGEPNEWGNIPYNMWLVKTDEFGNVEWNRTYGGPEYDEAMSLIKTSDGGYAIAGETVSYSTGSNDFWLVKTDAYGNMEWNQTYGGQDVDWSMSLIETSDGGYAMVGGTYSFGVGSGDFLLIKTDELGVIPESTSCLLPALLLVATFVVIIYTKRNYSTRK